MPKDLKICVYWKEESSITSKCPYCNIYNRQDAGSIYLNGMCTDCDNCDESYLLED